MILNPTEEIKFGKVVGLDIETNGVRAWIDAILVVSITTNNITYVLETKEYSKQYFIDLFNDLQNCGAVVVGQNIKFDLGFIYFHYGIMLTSLWDTMLSSQICTNGLSYRYTLNEIIARDLGIHTIDSDIKKYYQRSFVGLPIGTLLTKEQLEYAGSDTEYLPKLYKAQQEIVKQNGLENIVRLELRLLPVITKMEVRGCKIDRESWEYVINNKWNGIRDNYINQLDDELRHLSVDFPSIYKKYLKPRRKHNYTITDLFGNDKSITVESSEAFNFASAAQILDLFAILGQPLPSVKEGEVVKNSAGEEALKTYITEYPKTPLRRFIELLLKFREYEKLISTYGHKFLDLLDHNNYIHTTYSQCHTKTGRLASRNPNLQNIPATSLEKDGYDIRQYFKPDDGCVMITSDMAGAEVRIAADYSKDEKLLASILNDEDLHSILASKSYSIIFGKKTKVDKSDKTITASGMAFKSRELRDRHKSVLFAKFYKGGSKRVYEVLAEYINLFHTEDQMEIAGKISRAIDKELPKLSKYLTSLIETAQKDGCLRGSKLGRIRYFDANVYGEAANFPIQNTNAEAMKIALVKLDAWFEETGYGRLVMNIHDEVVCSVKKEHQEECGAMIKKIMSEALGWFLDVIPGDAGIVISEHWKK